MFRAKALETCNSNTGIELLSYVREIHSATSLSLHYPPVCSFHSYYYKHYTAFPLLPIHSKCIGRDGLFRAMTLDAYTSNIYTSCNKSNIPSSSICTTCTASNISSSSSHSSSLLSLDTYDNQPYTSPPYTRFITQRGIHG